ncbi:MAG: hypothetical protein FWF18_04665 [Dehalococcoidia bacterium]|nr:hypothetical protein [Dehalococcoidia bacterium]
MNINGIKSITKKPRILFAGILSVLLCLAIVFASLTFISFREGPVAKVGNTAISANLYRYALLMAKENILAKYPDVDLDELWNYRASGSSTIYARTLEESELGNLIRTAAINNLFMDLGLQLTDAQNELRRENIAKAIESYGGMEKAKEFFKKYYITYDDFVGFYEDYDRYELLFLYYFGVNGVYPVSFLEIDSYYASNNARIKSIYIPIVDAAGRPLSADASQRALELAQQVAGMAGAAGSDFEELIALYNKDTNLPANGYIITKGYNAVPEYAASAFAMSVGEVRAIATNGGYYIMKKYSVLDASVYTQKERQRALLEMKKEAFDDLVFAAISVSRIERDWKLIEKIRIDEITHR